VVDDGIREIVEVLEDYWRHDDRTAYVFTSDHGMTDWGSHGTGMLHETEVPIVAWGAGVTHPEQSGAKIDVKQADIAPLMATLIGANVPKNSVGSLPTDFLKLPPEQKVQAELAVARQAFEMFKSSEKRFQHHLYTPLKELDETIFEEKAAKIQKHVQVGKISNAQNLAKELHKLSLEGVEYYRTYFRTHLFVAVSLSYVGFILLVSASIAKNFMAFILKDIASRTRLRLNVLTAITSMIVCFVYQVQNTPWHYIFYYLTPVLIWHLLVVEVLPIKLESIWSLTKIAKFCFIGFIIECTVLSFHQRHFLIPVIIGITLCQIMIARKKSSSTKLLLAYIVLSLALCAFTLQPSIGKERNNYLVLTATILSLVGAQLASTKDMILKLVLLLSGICVCLSTILEPGSVPKLLIQGLSWTVFLSGVPLAMRSNAMPTLRLVSVSIALQASYIILSLSYEGLFMLCLMATMYSWVCMESGEVDQVTLFHDRERKVVSEPDIFRALLFLCYTVISFFGTGNIASLNSFDPKSIKCLVSVFNPFLMGAILLAKVLIPFLTVSCFTLVVKHVTQMHSRALFLLVLLFSDVMGLHFFFLVTDQGSWQEIGTSLSHFVIAEATVIFLQLFFLLAGWMLNVTERPASDSEHLSSYHRSA
jgi:phosphatidylinositol glycan class N